MLQLEHSLPPQGSGIALPIMRFLNAAVRASSADFAALCYDEIWPDRRRPHLDLAIVDYTFTSTAPQLTVLVDRLQSLGIPTLALLQCRKGHHQRVLQCGHAQTKAGHAVMRRSGVPDTGRYCDELLAAAADGARSRYDNEPLKPAIGAADATVASDSATVSADSAYHHYRARVARRAGEGAFATLATDPRLSGNGARLVNRARTLYEVGINASHRTTTFASELGAHAAFAVAAMEDITQKYTTIHWTKAVAAIERALRTETSRYAWMARRALVAPPAGERHKSWAIAVATAVLASCVVAHAPHIHALHERHVPYATLSAEQLALPAELVLADGVHPSATGHKLTAEAAAKLLRLHCNPTCCNREQLLAWGPQQYPDQVCRMAGDGLLDLVVASQAGNVLASAARDGFELARPGDGRSIGLAANRTGAQIAFRLASSTLQAGFVIVAYERGFRNVALGRLSCRLPCVCQPQLLNASSDRRVTIGQLSKPVWAQMAPSLAAGPRWQCIVEVSVESFTAGRLMLTAMVLSAALGSKNSTIKLHNSPLLRLE